MPVTIDIEQSYDLSKLANEWRDLETRSDPSFFLSWAWIGCWLGETKTAPLLVRARHDNQTVGLGLLARHTKRRHGMNIRQLYLHETGTPSHDRLTIEHNGLLMASNAPDDLVVQVLVALQNSPAAQPWDELVLSGVSAQLINAISFAGLSVELDRQSPDYVVDLHKVRTDGTPWRAGLSANLRAQIRQSETFASRMGPVRLTAAGTVEEAHSFFEGLRALHTAYWQTRSEPGAFADAFAVRFHRALIADQFQSDQVQLLRLAAGDQVLGYLYNFSYRGRISSYQSGFSYQDDNRHRPGLLAHVMAIEQALLTGARAYDFLAGDSPYKARLGDVETVLFWCRAQRRAPGLYLERQARKIKSQLTRLRRANRGQSAG